MESWRVMPSRASRNKNPVSPFDRVLSCYGIGYIRKAFKDSLNNAITMETVLCPSQFKSIKSTELWATSQSTERILIKCKVRPKGNSRYPTIKIRLASKDHMTTLCNAYGEGQRSFDQSSIPLDLHRLAALSNMDWNIDAVASSDHAIHRCHNKKCFNPEHIYFGTNDTNKSTEFCPAWILVNSVLINCCHHNPICLVPGNRVIPLTPTTI